MLGVVAALALSEAALRWGGFEYNPLQVVPPAAPAARAGAGNPLDFGFAYAPTTEHFVYDPELIWRPRPGHVVFDRRGLRGEVRQPKPVGELRILALGDSNTLGWIAPDGANWPGYLGELFTADSVRVINAGVWGYSSFQGRRRLERLRDLEPDLVLISFGANDAHHRGFSDRRYADRIRLLLFLKRLRLGQLVLRAVDARASLLERADGRRVPRVGLDDYRRNLLTMVERVRGDGGVPVLLTRPFVGLPPVDPLWWRAVAPAYNRATLEVARERGVESIDLHAAFADQDRWFVDESHFTTWGHRRAAELIYERLHPLVPVEPAGRRRLEIRGWPSRLSGFYPEGDFPRWTDGDATVEGAGLRLPGARWLALETYGWRAGDPRTLGLRVEADGRELRFSRRDGAVYLFELAEVAAPATSGAEASGPGPVPTVDTIRVRSSTFSPAGDPRRLGLDLRAVSLRAPD